MDSSASTPQAVRRPMQERGRRRFDAILDAAAAILVESGRGGFTMHGVAARANTSIGSMYHFFPDGESVLFALGERHVAALEDLLQGLRETDDTTWASAPLAAAVDAILNPILGYMEAHPDLFALAREPHSKRHHDECEPEGHRLDMISIEVFEKFIRARTPSVSATTRLLRARVMQSITEGVAMRAGFYSAADRIQLFRELRVAMTAYLAQYERYSN